MVVGGLLPTPVKSTYKMRKTTVKGIPKLCETKSATLLALPVKVELNYGKLINHIRLSHSHEHTTIISVQSHMDCVINTLITCAITNDLIQ